MNEAARDRCLERLLSPIGFTHFVEQYWEREVLHINRDDPDRYASLLSAGDIETLLSTQRLELSDVQLSAGAASPPPSDYLDANGHVVTRRLLDGHRKGATLVLSQAQRRIPSLADFCRDIHAGLAMRCQTNAYLSPAGQQGFQPHYDSHDVFILQVQGRKVFNFYGGGPELPANHHRFDAALHRAGDLQSAVELTAGDALYIPRGVMHDAAADRASPSLHITLGLFPLTLMDVLQDLLARAETNDADFRRSIPGAFDMGRDQDVQQRLSQCMAAATSTPQVASSLALLRNDLAADAPPDVRHILNTTGDAVDTSPGQTIVASLEQWHDIEETDGRVVVRTAGAALSFNGEHVQIIRRLASGAAVGLPSDGSDSDPSAMIDTLAQYGLIRTVDPPS